MARRSAMILLRPLRAEDIEETIKWRNDPETTALVMGFRYPVTQQMEQQWYQKALSFDPSRVLFAIDEIESGNFVGITRLEDIDYVNRRARYGIVIGINGKRGKGFGTEATIATVRFGFDKLNLRKITLEVLKVNENAIRMYKNIGFVIEGSLREHFFMDNSYLDVLIMSLFKDDFNVLMDELDI